MSTIEYDVVSVQNDILKLHTFFKSFNNLSTQECPEYFTISNEKQEKHKHVLLTDDRLDITPPYSVAGVRIFFCLKKEDSFRKRIWNVIYQWKKV